MFKFLVLLIFLFSCSSEIKKKTEEVKEISPPLIITPIVEVTPAPFVTVDETFNQNVTPLWEDFFKTDFTETKAIDIYIATNRKLKSNRFGCADEYVGVDFDANLQFGLCRVNVPKNHTTGEINQAKTSRQSSHDFFKILMAKSYTEKNFVDVIKETKRTPLVFVHGFNVRFGEAVLRAAQIAYDLKYQGPVLLYTWPAGAGDGFFDQNRLGKTYEQNSINAKNSVVLFKKFLESLSANQLKVNLVVHSMGHQVVLPALKEIGEIQNKTLLINELILNAPDFSSDEFIRLTDIIKPITKRITLYCSYNDKAMMASESVNNNERLGACSYSENIDSINVSLIDSKTFALGHGYYSSREILSDVFLVLMGLDADKRLFIKKSEPNSTEKYYLRP